ncbi:MAG TPA: S8 family serine peptidase [Streptosporangiaceae bacterium]|nr:S8 family serine peptidase [Streptosporangiaceae bacterium]
MRQAAGWPAAGAALAATSGLLLMLGGSGAAAAARPGTPAAVTATASPTASATASPTASASGPGQPTATASVVPSPPATPVPQIFRVLPRPSRGCPPQLGAATLRDEPWAQRALDMAGAWAVSQGHGITVAVVDSGVDYGPQLAGRVSAIDLTGQGPRDCVGHGTAVASLIAASDARARGIPFYGVAPAARILSVKVNTGETGFSRLLAQGIRDAATAGAQVINVSVQTAVSSSALRSAVVFAQRRDAVVVAAAGNDNPGSGVGPYYPASYPGVISVGAVDQAGTLASYTDRKTRVSVTAPGANVASAWPGGYNPANQGTSFAAAFVSGVTALVRAAYPRLTAVQVIRRVEATADGPAGAHTGAGLVNAVQAVTGVLPEPAVSPAAAPQPVAIPRPSRPNPFTRALALSITGGALAVAILVAVAAYVIPRGRRRHWRPAGQTRAGGPLAPDRNRESSQR